MVGTIAVELQPVVLMRRIGIARDLHFAAAPEPDHVADDFADGLIGAVVGTEIPTLAVVAALRTAQTAAEMQISAERLEHVLPGAGRVRMVDFDPFFFLKRPGALRGQPGAL